MKLATKFIWTIAALSALLFAFPAGTQTGGGGVIIPAVPESYGAAGSTQSTTCAISASSNILTLGAALDFENGQEIRCNHAGANFALGAPGAPIVTVHGTPGTTTYFIAVSALDSAGGVGAAVRGSTAVGNTLNCNGSTLTGCNYLSAAWTPPSGTPPASYAVWASPFDETHYRLLGVINQTSLNIVSGNGCSVGTMFPACASDWIPQNPGSDLPDWLISRIVSGGGSTTLLLADNASNTVSSCDYGQPVCAFHDDTAAINAAIAEAISGPAPLQIGLKGYPITGSLNIDRHVDVRGFGASGIGSAPSGIITDCTGSCVLQFNPFSHTFFGATDDQLTFSNLEILYPIPASAYTGAAGIVIASSGGPGPNGIGTVNFGSVIDNVAIIQADRGIGLINAQSFNVYANVFFNNSTFGLLTTSDSYAISTTPSSGDWTLGPGNTFWSGSSVYQAHVLVETWGGGRFIGNKCNTAGNNAPGQATACFVVSPSRAPVNATLTTNAVTPAGNGTLHFASVPISSSNTFYGGLYVHDVTNPTALAANTLVAPGATITSTTVPIIPNAIGAGVQSGDVIEFITGTNTEPLQINDNSMEGSTYGVLLDGSAVGNSGTTTIGEIVGNQMWIGSAVFSTPNNGYNGQCGPAAAASCWIAGWVISSNNFLSGEGSSVIDIGGCNSVLISANMFSAISLADSAIKIEPTCSHVTVTPDNVFSDSFTNPVVDLGSNDVIPVSCSGAPSPSFSVKFGIITHC